MRGWWIVVSRWRATLSETWGIRSLSRSRGSPPLRHDSPPDVRDSLVGDIMVEVFDVRDRAALVRQLQELGTENDDVKE